MPDFDKLFAETSDKFIKYNEANLVRYDEISFNDGDRFIIKFEKTNSEWRQGILLFVFGLIEIDHIGEIVQDRTVFFEDTAPKELSIAVYQDKSKRSQPKKLPLKGLLGIKNVWDWGNGTIQSWIGGSAMIVEEIENGRRYRCNDGHPDDNFNDIVFTIQRVSS